MASRGLPSGFSLSFCLLQSLLSRKMGRSRGAGSFFPAVLSSPGPLSIFLPITVESRHTIECAVLDNGVDLWTIFRKRCFSLRWLAKGY